MNSEEIIQYLVALQRPRIRKNSSEVFLQDRINEYSGCAIQESSKS